MTILLLGGNGLLGHNVLKALLQRGHSVHALVRRREALHTEGMPAVERMTVLEGSLLDDDMLAVAAQGCEAIVNCAGVTDMSLLRYEDYLPVNRDLCRRLTQLMEGQGISRLVHTGTANTIGYGSPAAPADEGAPMQAPFTRSFYAQSKREGEALLLRYAEAHPERHVVVVCPGFMVGAYDTKPSSGALLLAGYRRRLMPVPSGGKSFVAVADAAEAVANALTQGRSGQRYLLTGENLTLKEFYRRQAQVCGYRQRQVSLPDGLLRLAGWLGDGLRWLGIRTQLSTRNVRQLMVREYYDNRRSREELSMPSTPLAQAIADFFAWRGERVLPGNK